MKKKVFKKIINDLLISKGFLKKGNYYLRGNEIMIVIGLQKSNFSNSYFINLGYIISELHTDLENPRDVDGDIRARFDFEKDGKDIDLFSIDDFIETDHGHKELKNIITDNLRKYVDNVVSLDTLRSLLVKKPVMLYQTKLNVKTILGLE